MAQNSNKTSDPSLLNVGVQKLEKLEKPDGSNLNGSSDNQINLNLNVINHCKIKLRNTNHT